jgi:hypothetical protein
MVQIGLMECCTCQLIAHNCAQSRQLPGFTLPGFRTFAIVRYSKKLKNTAFREMDQFPFSGEGWETLTVLDPLERAYLNHWTTNVSITTAI